MDFPPHPNRSDEDKIVYLKERMVVKFPEPIGQFYEASAKVAAKKRGKELMDPLKRQGPVLSKQSSKAFKVGKKLKGARLSDSPLLAALFKPNFNPTELEDLDGDNVYFNLLIVNT